MQPSTEMLASSPNGATADSGFRVPLGRAMTLLLLVAVLSTALFVHAFWNQAAGRNIDKIVGSLDAQSASSVRRELTATFAAASGTAEIIRSVLFQGTIKADDEVKREFLFLSLLQANPSITWIGFGFPDGRFFGSHARSDGKIEMVEISAAPPGQPHSLRRDLYRPIPGDVMFEERIKGESVYTASGALWYRKAGEAGGPAWTVADILPSGFEPAAVASTKVNLYGNFQGVVMVAVGFDRLSDTLAGLDISRSGQALVLDRKDAVIANSVTEAGNRASKLSDFPAANQMAGAIRQAVAGMHAAAFRTMVDEPQLGPVYVSSTELPFDGWRLLTSIPRSAFAEEIDRNTQRLLLVVGGLVLVAALTAVIFANLLFARPIGKLAGQLRLVERFALDDVRHEPSFLAELDDFSGALRRMAGGLSAFARYMPLDIVRPLVAGGIEPKPGGQLTEVTVMFADLPGFTELTEKLGPGVEPYLTEFLTLAVAAVHAEGGLVDKFIGDAVMAIWNAPTPTPDHAQRACRAALAIRNAMHAKAAFGPWAGDTRVRIGINTGTALVGNVGSAERLSYTAIGDTVNLASRLVGVAKERGVEILASDATVRQAGSLIPSTPLGIATVRGKATAVQIHALGVIAGTKQANGEEQPKEVSQWRP